MGCHSLLQETFPTQGLNPGLLHYGQTLYRLSRRRSSSVFSAAVRNGHRVRETWPLAGRAALAAAPASICQGSVCTRVPQPLSCRLREFPSSSLLKSCPASGCGCGRALPPLCAAVPPGITVRVGHGAQPERGGCDSLFFM